MAKEKASERQIATRLIASLEKCLTESESYSVGSPYHGGYRSSVTHTVFDSKRARPIIERAIAMAVKMGQKEV